MTVDEISARLRARLQEEYGVDEAAILMDRPPGGWGDLVTNQSLDRRLAELEARLDAKLDAKLEAKFEAFEYRITSLLDRGIRGLAQHFAGLQPAIGADNHPCAAEVSFLLGLKNAQAAHRAEADDVPTGHTG